MFHQCNCLCVSQTRNSQEIKLRCILIKIEQTLKKSTARFRQFTFTTLVEKNTTRLLQKIQMVASFLRGHQDYRQSTMSASEEPSGTLHGGAFSKQLHKKTWDWFWSAWNPLSEQFMSKRRESSSWLQSNHGQNCPSVIKQARMPQFGCLAVTCCQLELHHEWILFCVAESEQKLSAITHKIRTVVMRNESNNHLSTQTTSHFA